MQKISIEKLSNGNVKITLAPARGQPLEVELPADQVESLASMLQIAARSAFFHFTQAVGS